MGEIPSRVRIPLSPPINAPVAQLDRVFGYEPKGREFESLRAHHLTAFSKALSQDKYAERIVPRSEDPWWYSGGAQIK
jgi:hypothetical protein